MNYRQNAIEFLVFNFRVPYVYSSELMLGTPFVWADFTSQNGLHCSGLVARGQTVGSLRKFHRSAICNFGQVPEIECP